MSRWMPRVHHLTRVRQGREYQGERRVCERRGREWWTTRDERDGGGRGKCEAPGFTLGIFSAAGFVAFAFLALAHLAFFLETRTIQKV